MPALNSLVDAANSEGSWEHICPPAPLSLAPPLLILLDSAFPTSANTVQQKREAAFISSNCQLNESEESRCKINVAKPCMGSSLNSLRFKGSF